MYRLMVVLLFVTPVALAQFTYQKVDIPGATSTQVRGINSSNEIVGFYRTTSLFSCTDYDLKVPNCAQHGFKIVNGVLTKLDVPNSVSTAITGVNDYGDLVGYYQIPMVVTTDSFGFIQTRSRLSISPTADSQPCRWE